MKRPRQTRRAYAYFTDMTTRWRDNDAYGHMNNVVFYEYVDTCVNGWLKASGALDVPGGPVIGLVVESACVFHAPLGFPEPVAVGLRVSRIGTSSVQYDVGLFAPDGREAAAEARFTHVYVARDTRRPMPLPDRMREALASLQVSEADRERD
ncbi:acyl-CoA thioesterase [Algicella marina]|uniref:Acyl-CoA thioesterase n=1 Tax=Algicella marina TaxID=2683284 RepID=A0A6P1SYA6_9RHOB|nr:thioesterase family protein [Algicella marina]QHQ33979.1 acyl-CoA thioesterase [Algicella marina]